MRAAYNEDAARDGPCQTSKTRMCARLEIRTGRLAHTYVASRRARAVRAKCSLAGLTTTGHARMVKVYPTCCPLVRFSHIGGSIKDAARDGPCAHGKVKVCGGKNFKKVVVHVTNLKI